MRLIDTIINFFTTKFYNNLKYSNSFVSLTRIFFERNNKLSTTVAQLGNVYRNSKWSDLKISNIKPSSSSQFLKNFVFLFILFIVSYSTLTWVLGLFSIETYPLSQIWFYFADIIQYGILILLRCIYLGFEKIVTTYSNLIHKLFFKTHKANQVKNLTSPNHKLSGLEQKSLKQVPMHSHSPHQLYNELSINLSKNPIIDEEKLLYMWFCQKCVLCLHQVDRYIDFNSFDHSNKLIRNLDLLEAKIGPLSPQTIARILYMETINSVKPEPNQVFFLKERTDKYTNFFFLKKFGFNPMIAHNTRTYSLDFNKLKFLNFSIKKILIDNIEKNVAITKQNKWAWRSSILSDNFLLKNLSITNTKKLISTNNFSNSSLKKNIWTANKLNNNKNFLKLNTLLLQPTSVYGLSNKNVYSNLQHNAFNFSENSILWLAKRFFLTQNMSLNYITYNTVGGVKSLDERGEFTNRLKSLETLGTNNLALFFNVLLNTNFVKQENVFSYYDTYLNNSSTKLIRDKSGATQLRYLIEFADQITFSTTFLVRFASHFSNTLVFDKNSLVLFSNISYSNQDINIRF